MLASEILHENFYGQYTYIEVDDHDTFCDAQSRVITDNCTHLLSTLRHTHIRQHKMGGGQLH